MTTKLKMDSRIYANSLKVLLASFWMALVVPSYASADEEIEEIVVTARATEQSVRDVPVAITTFSEETMENMALRNLEDIAASSSSVEISKFSSGSGAVISIRGISSSPGSIGIEQSVATMIDGVYFPQARSIGEGLFDASQVSILKGPQALYFGKNATAGVLAIITNDPGDEFESSVRVGYETETKTTSAEAVISTPINDQWGIRLALQATDMSDGYLENIAGDTTYTTFDVANGFAATTHDNPASSNSWIPGEESISGRLTLKGQLSDDITLKLKGTYTDVELNSGGLTEQYECDTLNGQPHTTLTGDFDPVTGRQRPVPAGLGECEKDLARGLNPIPPSIAATSSDLNRFGGDLGESYESYIVTADLEWEFDQLFWKTIVNYHDQTVAWVIDADANEVTSIFASENNQFENFSIESRAATRFDGPLNGVLGLYYQTTERKFRQEVAFAGAENSAADPSNRFLASNKASETDGDTISAYAELIWDIAEQWQLSAGGRYIDESKDSFFTQPYVNPAFAGLFVQGRVLSDDRSFDDFFSEVTLRFQPNENVTAYVAYREGFKSGGFDNGAIDSTLLADPIAEITFEPETVSGIEGGVKASMLDGVLSLDFDAYFYEYEDLQLNFFNSDVFAYRTLNAGAAETLGAELQLAWSPLSVDGLTLTGSIAYSDSTYKEFIAPCFAGQSFADGCTIGTPPAPFGLPSLMEQNLDGEVRNLAPEWAGNLGLDYTIPVGSDLELGFLFNMKWTSEYSTSDVNPSAIQDGYQWYDAAIRLGSTDGRWQIAAIGKNLSDEYVILQAQPTASTGGNTGTDAAYRADYNGYFLRPFSFEIEFSYNFYRR